MARAVVAARTGHRGTGHVCRVSADTFVADPAAYVRRGPDRQTAPAKGKVNAMRLATSVLAIGMLALGATPALAVVPSNDTIAGAVVISALPFSDSADTTDASTDPDELAAAAPCLAFGAPAIEHAVWYAYTATASLTLHVDTSASSYTTGIVVYNGAPNTATFVTCAPAMLTTPVAAGTTAYIMVFSDQPASAGGTLSISVSEAPPPPEVTLTADGGSFDPMSGGATVSGTYLCTGSADYEQIYGTLTQAVGRFTISGFFNVPLICDGAGHVWTATVTAMNGQFKGGLATIEANATACSLAGCDQAAVTQRLRLRPQ